MTSDTAQNERQLTPEDYIPTVYSSFWVKSYTRFNDAGEELKGNCFNFSGASGQDVVNFGIAVLESKWTVALSLGNIVLIELPTGNTQASLPEIKSQTQGEKNDE